MKQLLERPLRSAPQDPPRFLLLACPPVLDAYEFGQFRTVADISGGHGLALSCILSKCPELRGLLFDRPSVVADAPAFLDERGVLDRVQLVGGDIFTALPEGVDAYLLQHVLREWPDNEAEQILRNVAKAMSAQSKCLVIESALDERMEDPASMSRGGRPRTLADYSVLFERAGLRMTRALRAVGGSAIIEAVPA